MPIPNEVDAISINKGDYEKEIQPRFNTGTIVKYNTITFKLS